MWLGMLLLLALAVFIILDSRRLRRERPEALSRETMARGFLPRGLVAWRFCLGFGGVLALLAFIEWEKPSAPPFTGRWSWLHRALFEALGVRGLFAWWALMAALFLAYGVVLLRRERSARHE